MNIIAARLATKILQNPIKYYTKVIPVGFGVTMVANYSKALFDDQNAIIKIYEHPVAFTAATAIKSMWYGSLWPIIPIMAFCQPRRFFTLGSGMREMIGSHSSRVSIPMNDKQHKYTR